MLQAVQCWHGAPVTSQQTMLWWNNVTWWQRQGCSVAIKASMYAIIIETKKGRMLKIYSRFKWEWNFVGMYRLFLAVNVPLQPNISRKRSYKERQEHYGPRLYNFFYFRSTLLTRYALQKAFFSHFQRKYWPVEWKNWRQSLFSIFNIIFLVYSLCDFPCMCVCDHNEQNGCVKSTIAVRSEWTNFLIFIWRLFNSAALIPLKYWYLFFELC